MQLYSPFYRLLLTFKHLISSLKAPTNDVKWWAYYVTPLPVNSELKYKLFIGRADIILLTTAIKADGNACMLFAWVCTAKGKKPAYETGSSSELPWQNQYLVLFNWFVCDWTSLKICLPSFYICVEATLLTALFNGTDSKVRVHRTASLGSILCTFFNGMYISQHIRLWHWHEHCAASGTFGTTVAGTVPS